MNIRKNYEAGIDLVLLQGVNERAIGTGKFCISVIWPRKLQYCKYEENWNRGSRQVKQICRD